MRSPVIFSCLFTSGHFDIHKAPVGYRCIFFTNCSFVAKKAAMKGWEPCKLNVPEGKNDLENSLISKRIKFLNVLKSREVCGLDLNLTDGVLVFDHKFMVKTRHVRRIVESTGGKKVVIRATPRVKSSIWDEVEEAERQERYRHSMPETIQFIQNQILRGFNADTLICNTGLIYYADIDFALPLADLVIDACDQLQQPECQIFWAIFSQSFSAEIKVLDWRAAQVADLQWKDPVGPEKFPDGRSSLWWKLWWRFQGFIFSLYIALDKRH